MKKISASSKSCPTRSCQDNCRLIIPGSVQRNPIYTEKNSTADKLSWPVSSRVLLSVNGVTLHTAWYYRLTNILT